MEYPPATLIKSWLTPPVKLDEHDNGYVYTDAQNGRKIVILYIDEGLKVGYSQQIIVTHLNPKDWEREIKKANTNLMSYWNLVKISKDSISQE